MRLVIIDEENNKMQVMKDGQGYGGLDGSALDPTIHAVQWYGESGEIEYKDPTTGSMTGNEEITDISPFQFAVDAWQAAYDAEQAEIAAAQAAYEASQQAQPE